MVGLWLKTPQLAREDWSSILGAVKSDTVLSKDCHSCGVSSELCCQALSSGDGPRHSSHALA